MISYLEGKDRKTLLQHIQKLNNLYDAYADLFKRIIDVYRCFYFMLDNLENSLFGHLLLKQRNINYKYKTLFNPTFLNHYYEKGDLEEKQFILRGQLHSLTKDQSLYALLTIKDEGIQMFNVYLELKNFSPEDLKINPNQHFIAVVQLLSKNNLEQQLDYVLFDKLSKDWSKHLKINPIKKIIPINPHKIGLMICDDNIKAKKFHKILQKELPLAQIVTFPVSTTKPDLVAQIANTIKKINQEQLVDLF